MEKGLKQRRDQYVFRRDKWQCRMPVCLHPEKDGGRAILPALYRTDSPWAPTVDHILPRSKGGTNREDNLRAAHRICNAAHGNREYPDRPVVRPARDNKAREAAGQAARKARMDEEWAGAGRGRWQELAPLLDRPQDVLGGPWPKIVPGTPR